MSVPHPVPIIAQVLNDLADRLEERASLFSPHRVDANIRLAVAAIAKEIRQLASELQ